ncbi:MAG TPA: ATP-binding protein [Polyangiaceae bacterium]|nr:ATP-binding protein [Polyangiaceae bacterium]
MRDPVGSRNPTPAPPSVTDSDSRELGSNAQARRGSERPIADPWRDVLLALALDLPVDAGQNEVTERFLDGLSALLPHLALGTCVIMEPGERPVISVRLPPGASDAMQRDPTRLFPILREERVLPLDDASTFHVGSQTVLPPLDLQIAERAALVLSRSLARAQSFRRVHGSARNLERLQAHMIQAEKLASLGQIVAGVVHELNNPLTSIIAYSEYLTRKAQARLPEPEATDDLERLRRIQEAAGRILRFSRDLVAYARPSNEIPGPVSLVEVVDKALVFCEHEFAGIAVKRELPPTLPAIRGVAGALTQVFVNLFTNAAHAMGGGGELSLRARIDLDARAVLLDIEDSGVGIGPEHLPLVFEPFFTTKSEGRGSGLGLSIVRGILDAAGGTIEVDSVPGEGTTFTLTLPIAATGSLIPKPSSGTPVSGRG